MGRGLARRFAKRGRGESALSVDYFAEKFGIDDPGDVGGAADFPIGYNFENGFAAITAGNHRITIARRDEDTLSYLCPVDLLSASLGS